MTIRLEALSATDGTGIFRKDETLRLLRPPYTLHDSPLLPEESLRDALSRFGFAASTEQFSSWSEAIEFLNRKTVESRGAIGKELPEDIDGHTTIENAPEHILRDLLTRVENNLIPQKLFDQAENFLLAFLASNALTGHPVLAKKAAQLLQQTKTERQQADTRISELACRDLRFPSLEKHGELKKKCARMAEDIERRHCVFA
jgi:hypothetical protein